MPDDIIEGAQGLGNPGARVRFVGPEEKTNLREGSSNSSNSFAKNKLFLAKLYRNESNKFPATGQGCDVL